MRDAGRPTPIPHSLVTGTKKRRPLRERRVKSWVDVVRLRLSLARHLGTWGSCYGVHNCVLHAHILRSNRCSRSLMPASRYVTQPNRSNAGRQLADRSGSGPLRESRKRRLTASVMTGAPVRAQGVRTARTPPSSNGNAASARRSRFDLGWPVPCSRNQCSRQRRHHPEPSHRESASPRSAIACLRREQWLDQPGGH